MGISKGARALAASSPRPSGSGPEPGFSDGVAEMSRSWSAGYGVSKGGGPNGLANRAGASAPRPRARKGQKTGFGTALRTLDFLFSRNRLNVAVSRAMCLACIVASPRLLESRARPIEQMRLINALCRFAEMACPGRYVSSNHARARSSRCG